MSPALCSACSEIRQFLTSGNRVVKMAGASSRGKGKAVGGVKRMSKGRVCRVR